VKVRIALVALTLALVGRDARAELPVEAPASLVLGKDATATVSIAAPPGALPRIEASTGTLDAPHREADGRVTAVWHAPAKKVPGIAIVAAVGASGEVIGWTTIVLSGQAHISTHSKPHAKVTVRVGDQELGPVEADGKGGAEFIAVIPPGLTTAVSQAIDRLGAVKETVLDLAPPPFSRVMAICPDREADAMEVLVAGTGGKPSAATVPDVRASAARMLPPEAISAGRYRVRVDLDSATADAIDLEARLPGDAAPPARCRLRLPGESPSGVSLSLATPAFQAGSGAPVAVQAAFRYPGKRKPATPPISLSADFGVVTPATLTSSMAAQWRVPDALGGRSRAVLSARAGALDAKVELALAPGPIARVDAAAKSRAVADGVTPIALSVRAFDSHGNPVPDPPLAVSADAGAATASSFVPPLAYRPTTRSVTLRDPASGTSTILAVRCAPAHRRVSLTGRAGLLDNLGRLTGPWVAVAGGIRPPILSGRLEAALEAGAYQASARLPSATETVSVRLLATPLIARATFEPLRGLGLYAGGGAGLFLAQTSISSPTSGRRTRFDPDPAAGLLLGWEWPVGAGRLGAEASFWEARATGPVTGNLGGARVSGAYRREF
jgi:hypothetical protein